MSSGMQMAVVMMWPSEFSDSTHVAHGLFAVDTVEGNRWTGATGYVGCSAADALCPCLSTEGGGTSAGVAVAARSHMGFGHVAIEDMEASKSLRRRFVSPSNIWGGYARAESD